MPSPDYSGLASRDLVDPPKEGPFEFRAYRSVALFAMEAEMIKGQGSLSSVGLRVGEDESASEFCSLCGGHVVLAEVLPDGQADFFDPCLFLFLTMISGSFRSGRTRRRGL